MNKFEKILNDLNLPNCTLDDERACDVVRKALIEYKDIIQKRELKFNTYKLICKNIDDFYGDGKKSSKKENIVSRVRHLNQIIVDKLIDEIGRVFVSDNKSVTMVRCKRGSLSKPVEMQVNCTDHIIEESEIEDASDIIIGTYRKSDNTKYLLSVYIPIFYDFNDEKWKSCFSWDYIVESYRGEYDCKECEE